MSCHSLLIGANVAGVTVLVDDALGLAAGDRVGVGDETGLAPRKNVSFTLIRHVFPIIPWLIQFLYLFRRKGF